MDLMKRMNALEARVLTLDHNCSRMERLCEDYKKKIEILELQLQLVQKDVTTEQYDQILEQVLMKVGQLLDGEIMNELIGNQTIEVDENSLDISHLMEGDMVADNLEDSNLQLSHATHQNNAQDEIMEPVNGNSSHSTHVEKKSSQDKTATKQRCKNSKEKYKGPHCQEEFARKRDFISHGATKPRCKNSKEKYKCPHCQEEFAKKRDFILHGPSHDPTELYANAKYICKLCGKRYLFLINFEKHNKMCHKVHPYL